MSEVWRLPESECARARGLMAQFLDCDLAGEQSAWFHGHLEACSECRAALARCEEIDREITGWGQRLDRQNPPSPGARARLAERMQVPQVRRRSLVWIPAAAAAIAAALALAVRVPHPEPPAARGAQAPFIAIPYVPPLDGRENAAIVRMNIRVATLVAVGYRVAADPDTMVPADVLVGEDGQAHAVRVLSGINWSGTGD